MNRYILTFFIFFSLFAQAQRQLLPTIKINITGKIKIDYDININEIESKNEIVSLPTMIIKNHEGIIKDSVKSCKGILLKTFLTKIEFDIKKPRELNQFYFVISASDGYKVVFSWNEIFNTNIGEGLFIICQKELKNINEME